MATPNDDRDRLADLVSQAYNLTDEEFASLVPGSDPVAQLERLLAPPELAAHPFTAGRGFDPNAPDLSLLKVLRDPEYIRWACSSLLSMDGVTPMQVHPVHAVAFKALWDYRFTMLIASRGWGKCLAGDTLVVTDRGFRRIGEIVGPGGPDDWTDVGDLRVLGENGFRPVDKGYRNGEGETVVLETHCGYRLEGVPRHPVRVAGDGGPVWKTLGELTPDDRVLVAVGGEWFPDDNGLTPEEAFELGASAADRVPAEVWSAPKLSAMAFVGSLALRAGGFGGFRSGSERLAREVQFLMGRLGCVARLERDGDDWRLRHVDRGEAPLFYDRVKTLSRGHAFTYDLSVPGDHTFVSNGLVSHNTTYLGLFILMCLLFCQGIQVVVVSKTFRQAKQVFEVLERLWHRSPVLRSLVGKNREGGRDSGPHRSVDRFEFIIGQSVGTFLPLGATGDTIRGLRAQVTVVDEFASVNEEVYSTVIQGFGAVAADPVNKTIVKARERALKLLGYWNRDLEEESDAAGRKGNKSILAGTATYAFNHFHKYWRHYQDVITSRGDPKKLEDIFHGPPPRGFDHRDYAVVRMPYNLIPEGYMDDSIVARARATSALSIFGAEYNCLFISDSDGFFKRSFIEKATVGATEDPLPEFPSCGPADFGGMLRGAPGRKYYYGVDPARSNDNFAVVVVEAWPDHRRVVYCWTTTKDAHREKLKKGRAEHDYWRFCVRKLRDLFRLFPPAEVAMDSQGGGASVLEAFSDPDKLQDGETPVYEVQDPDKPKDSDYKSGLHVLRMVNFRDNKWLAEANWATRKDLEDRVLLFPRADALAYGAAFEDDRATGRVVLDGKALAVPGDTLEGVLEEIDELKDELTTIEVTTTSTGLERWDTPEAKTAAHGKGVLKKDRYSALLMANATARKAAEPPPAVTPVAGGFASVRASKGPRTPGSGPPLLYNGANPMLAAKLAAYRGGARVGGGRQGRPR